MKTIIAGSRGIYDDGKSRGTKDMIKKARKAGLKVFVYNLKEVNK